MSLQDALNIFLLIGLMTFIICILTITFFTIKALKAITSLAEDIKGKAQLRLLAGIPAIFLTLVSKFIKRGR